MLRTIRQLVTPLFLLSLLALAPQVWAHAHLQSHVPGEDSVLTESPAALEFKFSEGVELNFSKVTLNGPEKQEITLGKPALLHQDPTQLTVPVEEKLPAGVYIVDWHIVSVDGHKSKGQFSFTVKP